MNELMLFNYKDNAIHFSNDGYVNATEMAKSFSKQPHEFLRLPKVQEYINALISETGLSHITLIKAVRGNYSDGPQQGTWFHPKLALRFAQWLSPYFAVWVDSRIEELLTTGTTFISEDALILEAMTLLKSRNEKLLEDNTALTIQNKRMVPKAEFYDQVTGSRDAIEMSKVAKVLDIGIGRNKLFAILRDCQVLRADNTPYQAYIDSGYFRVIEQGYIRSDSTKHITFKTLVYQRGLDYIRKFLIRKGYSKNNSVKELQLTN